MASGTGNIGGNSTGGTSQGSGKSPVVSYSEFRELLGRAGIDASDEQLTQYMFRAIGPYRLMPYVSFVAASGEPAGTRNVQLLFDLFVLDRDLRLVFMRAIDVIETHLKAQCIQAFCEELGAACLYDPGNFKYIKDYKRTLANIEREVVRMAKDRKSRMALSWAASPGSIRGWRSSLSCRIPSWGVTPTPCCRR